MAEIKNERVFLGRLQLELPVDRTFVGGQAAVDGVTVELIDGYSEPNFNPIDNELLRLGERAGVEDLADIITDRVETKSIFLVRYKSSASKEAATRARAISKANIPLRFDARATAPKLDRTVERLMRVATGGQRLAKGGQLPANAFGLPYPDYIVSQAYRGRFEKARAVFDLPDVGRLDILMHSNGTHLEPTLTQRFSEAQETLAAFPKVKIEVAKLAFPTNPNFEAEAAVGKINGDEEKLIWVSVGALGDPLRPYIEVELTPLGDSAKVMESFGAIVSSLQTVRIEK